MPASHQTNADKIAQYQTLKGAPVEERVAHFLVWGARKHLGVLWTYKEIAMAINGYGKGHRVTAEEIEVVKASIAKARRILTKEHNMSYFCQRGVGIRATSGSDDIADYSGRREVVRLSAQRERTRKVLSIIDPDKFSNTPRGKDLKKFHSGVTKILNTGTVDEIKALLPPKP